MSCYRSGHRCGENGCKCVCTKCEGASGSDNSTVSTTNIRNAASARSNAGVSSRHASLAASCTDSSRERMSRAGGSIGCNADGVHGSAAGSTSPDLDAPIAAPPLRGQNNNGTRASRDDSTSPPRDAVFAAPFHGDDDEPPGLFDRITHHRNLRNGVVAVHRPAAPPPTYKVLDLTGDKTVDNSTIFGTHQYQYIDEYIGYDPRRRDDAFYCPENGDGELLHAVVYQDAMEEVYLINWRVSEKKVLQERYLNKQFENATAVACGYPCEADSVFRPYIPPKTASNQELQ